MTRGDEDIEGGLQKFLDTRKGGSAEIVGLGEGALACVASVPVRAERSIGPREGVFAFGTRGKWGESKKDERGGWGRGKKGTLARKPLYFAHERGF